MHVLPPPPGLGGTRRRWKSGSCRATSRTRARGALVLGVFRNVDPAGAAAAMDGRLTGPFASSRVRRMFGAQLGEVFRDAGRRAVSCSRNSCCSPASATSMISARRRPRSRRRTSFARSRGRRSRTSQPVLFGAGSGLPVAMALERQLQRIRGGVRPRGPGPGRPAHHDLRNRCAQVCGAGPGHRRGWPSEIDGDDLALVVDEVAVADPRPGVLRARKPASREAAPTRRTYWFRSPPRVAATTRAARHC